MRRISLAIVMLAALAGMACKPTLRGSGALVVKRLDPSGFDRVQVGHAFQVELRPAATHSVQVRIDDNLVEHLRVHTVGQVLHWA